MIRFQIILDEYKPLRVFDGGSVTSVNYRDNVFDPYVRFSGVQWAPSLFYWKIPRGHIVFFWSMNFSRVKIFDGWIVQPGLHTLTL